jgi:hypothetical protein
MLKDIRPGFRAFLLSDIEISTMVGGERVHGLRLPLGTLPGPTIVYSQISEQTDVTLDGPSGLVSGRMQVDAWAESFDEATHLALLVKDHLNGYRGPMGSDSIAVQVQGVFAEDARADYDSVANLYRVSRDYFLTHEES